MMTVAVLLGSVLACALLAALRSRRAPARDPASAREMHESVRALLDAARTSSGAVLAVLDATLRSTESRIDTVMIFEVRDDELRCAYWSGRRAEHFGRAVVRREDGARLPARAAQAGCRMLAPRDGAALLPTDRAALAAPMSDARGLRAVAYVSSSTAGEYPAASALVAAIECAAMPYALALEREADRADATYDGLTGVLTPRAFRRYLRDEIANVAARGGESASLWFIDTDRFKSVNDGFGHRAGDAVLQAMAALLEASAVPGLDAVARNGGDEFCALIRGTTKSAALDRARAFCASVRAHDFGVPVRITASVGVATFPFDASSSNELLETADAAMYHSKRAGRDRVSFAVERGRYAVYE